MNVLVVEPPAKAKTVNKYLGSGYKVLASYGHIRDLPSKDGSVRPNEDFAMDWEVDPKAAKRLGPRRRSPLLASPGGAAAQEGDQGRQGRTRYLQRHHPLGRGRGHGAS